jgi:hypothetical protein
MDYLRLFYKRLNSRLIRSVSILQVPKQWAHEDGVTEDLFDDCDRLWRAGALVGETLCLGMINLLKHKVPHMHCVFISLAKIPRTSS